MPFRTILPFGGYYAEHFHALPTLDQGIRLAWTATSTRVFTGRHHVTKALGHDLDLDRIAAWNLGLHCRELQKAYLRSPLHPRELNQVIQQTCQGDDSRSVQQVLYPILVNGTRSNAACTTLTLLARGLGVRPFYVTAAEYAAVCEALEPKAENAHRVDILHLQPRRGRDALPVNSTRISWDLISILPTPPPPPAIAMRASGYTLDRIAQWHPDPHCRALQRIYLRCTTTIADFTEASAAIARRRDRGFSLRNIYNVLINGSPVEVQIQTIETLAEALGAIPIYVTQTQLEVIGEALLQSTGLDPRSLERQQPRRPQFLATQHARLQETMLGPLYRRIARLEAENAEVEARMAEVTAQREALRRTS